jgi:hypothetical protein
LNVADEREQYEDEERLGSGRQELRMDVEGDRMMTGEQKRESFFYKSESTMNK